MVARADPAAVARVGREAVARWAGAAELTGVDFESAWRSRVVHRVGSLDIPFLDRETLIRNKRATARLQDLADVERLEGDRGESPAAVLRREGAKMASARDHTSRR